MFRSFSGGRQQGRMKHYQRSAWYGLGYLMQCEGTALSRCVPAVIIACAINYLCVEDIIPLTTSDTGSEV